MAHRLGRHGRRNRTLGATLLLLSLLCCSWCFGRKQHVEVVTQPAFVSGDFVKQAAPPIGALTLGFGLYLCSGGSKSTDTAATVLIYFGAQTGMNLYMKTVLSKIVINEEENLKGLPIGFLLTAVQQFVAFLAFCCFLVVGKIIGKGYRVKKLTSAREYLAVICFSVTFALNIGLNNFSLSLVAISINLIIRSCLPLSTAISQMLVGSLVGQQQKSIALMEWILMFVGVGCAALATYAKNMAGSSTEESAGLVLGVICCVASLFSGAFNMVLAGILGSELKLNPLDTTCYMALPAGIVLLLPALVVSHPMGKWPGFPDMTDWQVVAEVLARKPVALLPVAFSGILAFFYNILQYTLVHKLSAAYAAFAGNFNKAATVALSLALGLEALPAGGYGQLFLIAVFGNIAAFTVYSSHKASK
eukprot:CAMPEP_0115394502 /NCGR_PEP_ID=MMETSP0271-20121206/12299_1 /TAXON_ID=71861 /ORGANISM="Scrippsiella trochoidea, Strain CCMP3099" /LENGTH=417 /DNA_ID=CAMNT_0002818175 /DNA_START=70 /DNA_END=1323 /DNA_ORIENTATION=-